MAAEYLKRLLSQGKTLARSSLKSVDLRDGNIIVLSPGPLTSEEITQFDLGHKPDQEASSRKLVIGNRSYVAHSVANVVDQLADLIYGFLDRQGSMCILENSLAEARDAWLQRAQSRIATLGPDVFHFLVNGDTKRTIEKALREAQSIPVFIGALAGPTIPLKAAMLSTHAITAEQIEAFSRAAYCVFAGAYDGEGCVVWTNRPAEPSG
jgi:hypothetical protein